MHRPSSSSFHRPSFLRSSSTSRPPASSSSDHGPPDGSTSTSTPAPHLRHPLDPPPSTRATLTANLSKGFAAVAGTAATLGGNVGYYAKAAVKGDATVLGGEPGGWRETVGGWVGRKRSNSWIGKDNLLIFPGWAVQRPLPVDDEARPGGPTPGQALPPSSSSSVRSTAVDPAATAAAAAEDDPLLVRPFEIRLQLSLFASSSRPESAASRTQRLFTRMARSFADLPRIPSVAASSSTAPSRAASRAGSALPSPRGLREEEEEQEGGFFRQQQQQQEHEQPLPWDGRDQVGDRTLSSSPEPLMAFGGEVDPRTPTNEGRRKALPPAVDDDSNNVNTAVATAVVAADGDGPRYFDAKRQTTDPPELHLPSPPLAPTESATPPASSASSRPKKGSLLPNHRSASVGSAAPAVVSPSLGGSASGGGGGGGPDEAFPLPPSTPTSQGSTTSTACSLSSASSASLRSATASSSSTTTTTASSSAAIDDLATLARRGDLQQMHATLRARLQPFFATVIPHRDVRIDIRPRLTSPLAPSSGSNDGDEQQQQRRRRKGADDREPLWSKVVQTSVNGTYDAQIVIPWEDITSSPACLDLIFPERLGPLPSGLARPDWSLEITATLLQPGTGEPISDSAQPPPSSASTPLDNGPSGRSSVTAVSLDRSLPVGLPPDNPLPVVARRTIPLAGHKGIRVISDLDDTVKRTDLVGGLREVFRNVFCRDVNELEVEGMGALYRSLVPPVTGFHYVSNSPLELFEPIHSFLHANSFPEGFSLKLKFYGGRSLFHGLWEPAGERKARGVLEILEGFPDSQFVMFGDSAEQDLDLYTQIALERPHQVLGIFIRDVSARPQRANKPPTGLSSMTPLNSSASSIASSTSSSSSSTSTTTASTPSRSRSSTLDSTKRLVKSSIPSALRSGTASPRSSTSRSRSSSLLGGRSTQQQQQPQPTTSTGRPIADFEAAEVALKLEQTKLATDASTTSTTTEGPADRSIGQAPGELSEDVLDPLYANLPPSPQLTPTIVNAAQDAPLELMDEAVSSARAKALRRADEFRERFKKSRRELRKLGVVVEKFRRVEEVEDLVRDLVNGRPLQR